MLIQNASFCLFVIRLGSAVQSFCISPLSENANIQTVLKKKHSDPE